MKIKWHRAEAGDSRVVKRFAWLPMRIDNQGGIWLESYWSYEVCLDPGLAGFGWSNIGRWLYPVKLDENNKLVQDKD
jgi:hypothetical protein